jgi:ketosteroid isomerase-like protein
MKSVAVASACALIGCAMGAAAAERASELAAVVAAERAFAARAQVVNPRQAFAEFFAPDAVLFVPFAAPAFPRLTEAPDWKVDIQWRPVAAAISGAGDMGYTTGPAEYRRARGEAPFGFGHYTSVWQRQADGRYLVRIDIGIEHAAPPVRLPDWTTPAVPPRAAPVLTPDERAAARQELRALDARIGQAANPDTLRPVLADDARLHLGGNLPVVGRDPALELLQAQPRIGAWSPEGVEVAASGDFGFVYGRGRWQDAGKDDLLDLVYLNIWQRRDGAWRLLVLVTHPVPRPAKS